MGSTFQRFHTAMEKCVVGFFFLNVAHIWNGKASTVRYLRIFYFLLFCDEHASIHFNLAELSVKLGLVKDELRSAGKCVKHLGRTKTFYWPNLILILEKQEKVWNTMDFSFLFSGFSRPGNYWN